MSKSNKYLPIFIALLLIGAGAWYFTKYREPVHPVQKVPASAICSSDTQSSPAALLEEPYILEILGSSPQLSEKQKVSMSRWREQAAEMARKRPENIILNGPAGSRSVSLTFDDGPDVDITSKILDVLEKEGIKATFFVTGQQSNKFPYQVEKINRHGHLVLSHTFSHRQLDLASREAVSREIVMTDEVVAKITGKNPKGVRPPYGAINQTVVDVLVEKEKLTILWSIDTLDWAGDEAETVAANVLDNVRPGDIILMHSIGGRTNTVKALPIIIKGLREQGYAMVRVDELLQREL